MAVAMLVWSPINFVSPAKADELTPAEEALALASEREAMRALAAEDRHAAIAAARRHKP